MSSISVNDVKEYYGKVLKSTQDLKTSACVTPLQKMGKHVRDVMKEVHDEVVSRYYGCGLVVPENLDGCHILDLGSGSGRDCFVLSKLVGENGFVTGIDMTDEQIEIAQKYVKYHQEKFNFKTPNTKFVKGYIEDLKAAGIENESIDIIISNCVINLCKDKKSVLQEAYRVLKFGGEMYFSDVYADRVLSDETRNHKVLWGECISGALHWKELYLLADEFGFETPRVVNAKPFNISNPEFIKILGDAKFISVTYRLFKLPKNKQEANKKVVYKGTVPYCDEEITLDHIYSFKTDEVQVVDKSTANILSMSRFKDVFDVTNAPCCSKPTLIQEEDPFTIDSELDQQIGDSCCGSKC